jgi:hypothetical protein
MAGCPSLNYRAWYETNPYRKFYNYKNAVVHHLGDIDRGTARIQRNGPNRYCNLPKTGTFEVAQPFAYLYLVTITRLEKSRKDLTAGMVAPSLRSQATAAV